MRRLVCWLLGGIVLWPLAAVASGAEPIPIGEKIHLDSEILGEERPLLISLPPGYVESEEAYAVLYLLDGGANFEHAVGLTRFLSARARIPSLIVVGISNTDRNRDLTPPSSRTDPTLPVRGRGDVFLRFVAEELVPWVDQRYRARPVRLLVGHSLGGLFALYAAIERPDLFRAVISASASLQWNDQALLSQFEPFLKRSNPQAFALHLTTANEGLGLLAGNLKLAAMLAEKAPPSLRWKYEPMPRETHGTLPHPALDHGLEFIFAGWAIDDPVAVYDEVGFEGLAVRYAKARDAFGYDPRMPRNAFRGLAGGLVRLGRLEETLELFESHRDKYPVPPIFWALLAREFEKRGEANTALRIWRRVLEMQPDHQAAKAKVAAAEADVRRR